MYTTQLTHATPAIVYADRIHQTGIPKPQTLADKRVLVASLMDFEQLMLRLVDDTPSRNNVLSVLVDARGECVH